MKRPFTYYMHDNYDGYERREVIARQLGLDPEDEVFDMMGRPFYEVGLDCELDLETGTVTILGVKR